MSIRKCEQACVSRAQRRFSLVGNPLVVPRVAGSTRNPPVVPSVDAGGNGNPQEVPITLKYYLPIRPLSSGDKNEDAQKG